jgi:nicotinamidase-related amidase
MKKVALLVIDVQKGFDDPSWGNRNNPDAEANIASLISGWRKKKQPIIHVQHCSHEPDSPLRSDAPGYGFKDEARPVAGEKHFVKSVNSAFIGTDLEGYLRDSEVESLVVVGFTTDHCVSTTTRMAGNLGFKVRLVSDATATFDRRGEDGTLYLAGDIHNIHLASLNGEFCTVRSAEQILREFAQ